MPNEHNSNEPPTDPKSQPLPQSPVALSTPQQSAMSNPSNYDPEDESDAAKELAREFGIVEKFQIGTNLLLAAVGIVALVIYNGQLKEMRKATKATQTAAEAAKTSADTAALALQSSQVQFLQTLQQMAAQSKAMRESADSQVASNRAWLVPDLPPRNLKKIEDAIITWRNIGKTPATNVFFWREYFQGAIFPSRLPTCNEMESTVKKKPLNEREFQAFVAEGGTYIFGFINPPPWPGPQQPFISIHGCVWYTDIASNTEKSVEFFYLASQMKYSSTPSDTIFIGMPTHKPSTNSQVGVEALTAARKASYACGRILA